MIRTPTFIVPYLLTLVLVTSYLASEIHAAKPSGIQVLYYNQGILERVARNHMNPRFPAGDYVPTLRITEKEMRGCLTAVSWNTRHYVFENRILTIDFWDAKQKRWERHSCRAGDWQQRRHSTGSRQRFEINYSTAIKVNAVPQNTVARLISVGPKR